MKKINVFCCMVLLLAVSAVLNAQPRNTQYLKFPLEHKPEFQTVVVPPVLLKEVSLVATGDYLISLNYLNDTIFRVFKLPGPVYKGSFGIHGRGPRELHNLARPFVKEDQFYVIDFRTLDKITFKSGEKVNNANYVVSERIPLSGEMYPYNSLFIINPYICCQWDGAISEADKQLICFNAEQNEISFIIDFPDFFPTMPKELLPTFYEAIYGASEKRKRIAAVYARLPLLKIFDIHGDVLHETFVDEGPRQIQNIDDYYTQFSLLHQYYSSIKTTPDYIYAMFKAYNFERDEGERKRVEHTGRQIHVFDWDGNPLVKLDIDPGFTVFAPSPDNEWLYFIDQDHMDKIFKYNIHSLLNNR